MIQPPNAAHAVNPALPAEFTAATVTIPEAALSRLATSTGAAVKVWVALTFLAGTNRRPCTASYTAIALTAGVGRCTAIRVLRRLAAAGLVAIDRESGGVTPNTYTLLPDASAPWA